MLKWTVSRSLSTASSTPHGQLNKAARKPFRDLSNTPPTKSRALPILETSPERPAPGRRRRCRSHGSDLRGYFQATKPSSRSSKRHSVKSPNKVECFYQSTPRVDSDIGPLTLYAKAPCSAATLPTDACLLSCTRRNLKSAELPPNIVNEARVNLQSHVSDFFQQISVATSPEDVMEADSVPFGKCPIYQRSCNLKSSEPSRAAYFPKLARITRLNARSKTPYCTKERSPQLKECHTPLIGKLTHLKLDQDQPKNQNMNNTVTDVLKREQESNVGVKTVAEILIEDKQEREKVLNSNTENIYEEIEDKERDFNDSSMSISSASQLLENPSPLSWAVQSPSFDLEGEFTLKRQRGIRRKRPKDNDDKSQSKRKKRSLSLSPSNTRKNPDQRVLVEAVNRNVRRCVLETNLDSNLDSILDRPEESSQRKASVWELESPRSTMTDDFQSSKSFMNSLSETPETPLVATVRRCLKYSPESEPVRSERGSIEIEYSVYGDQIHVHIIRCKDLRRASEGPIHAYVKASLKRPRGDGVVKRTAVHRATPNPVFHETLVLPCPAHEDNPFGKPTSLDIAVWHRDRRARRSELLGCMTLPLPLSQDKEATWHPLEAGSGRHTSTPYSGIPQECSISPPLAKDGEPDNNNSAGDDLTYLRHLELEPLDPLTGLPLHPSFTARGGRTPCTITKRLIRNVAANQIPWGFSLSWGRPPRVERVDAGSPAERAGLRPGDHVVFVESQNVVTEPRDEILSLIQAATSQLVLEIYRKGGAGQGHRPSSVTLPPPLGPNTQHFVTFTAEVVPNLAPDAPPEEELSTRESRFWATLKGGQAQFMTPLAEHVDVLSKTDYMILFQNLEELMKLSEEIKDEGGGLDSYLSRVPRITAAYRRYLSGLQRACCLLVALRRNAAFAKLVCEPAVPQKRKPDLTGVILCPLEHYREMTRLLCMIVPKNCQQARDLSQAYREATANAGIMEPPRDTGKPLLSLQEVESRLVFARCKPFTLATPGRQWLFGGALAKVESRTRLQPTWALLLTDLLVFTRVSRDRVLFVTEEPLRLSSIAEACFTIRKRPTEFRLQVAITPNGLSENGLIETQINTGGCSPHSRPRRRLLVLRAPSPELKAVWHNLLQRQIIYVNTGCGGQPGLESPDEQLLLESNNFTTVQENTSNYELSRNGQPSNSGNSERSGNSLDAIIKHSQHESNHLAHWVRSSQHIPPSDNEVPLVDWTVEDLVERTAKCRQESEQTTSDLEQSSTSSASLSTVKSSTTTKKNTIVPNGKENSINICRRCHRSGCPTPPQQRDPFSPLPPKIAVLPPTPDICSRYRLRNGLTDSPGRNSPNCTSADGNTEDGSEDDLDCDGEPPYRVLRRFGTLSSLDQDDEVEDQDNEDATTREESPPPSGLRAWTIKASNYVVSKMSILEACKPESIGYLLHPPTPPERAELTLDQNDEEGTTSGGTSGDDIWGTPTSGGPDDESFTASPVRAATKNRRTSKPPYGASQAGPSEENLSLTLSGDEDAESESEEPCLGEINMDQLLSNGGLSMRFLGRRRLEPLPEEEDSPGKTPAGWW